MSLMFLLTIIGVIFGYSFLNSDNSNTAKFISELKGHDLKVKDITKEVRKEMPQLDLKTAVLMVEENERVYIENPVSAEESIKELIPVLTNPSVDFTGIPHLYQQDELVISYFGQNKKLLSALEEILGKSLVE
ncbi:hypothetical protein [Paenibacillus kobensis]|uniref:hypothetical protein n=1 Tax=Paenibacillus kobensis TaxID=59841 RepID=UPI000FDA1E57|nr:hypothetical protein [Paenibacillus kobensis]